MWMNKKVNRIKGMLMPTNANVKNGSKLQIECLGQRISDD